VVLAPKGSAGIFAYAVHDLFGGPPAKSQAPGLEVFQVNLA
jgi:hypothetical protein